MLGKKISICKRYIVRGDIEHENVTYLGLTWLSDKQEQIHCFSFSFILALSCVYTRIHITTDINDVNWVNVYVFWDKSQCSGTSKFTIFFQKQLFGGSHQDTKDEPIREEAKKLLLHANSVYLVRLHGHNRIIFTGQIGGDCFHEMQFQILETLRR